MSATRAMFESASTHLTSPMSPEAKVKYDAYVESLIKVATGEHIPQVSEAEYDQWLLVWNQLDTILTQILTAPEPIIDKLLQKEMVNAQPSPGQGLRSMILGFIKSKAQIAGEQ